MSQNALAQNRNTNIHYSLKWKKSVNFISHIYGTGFLSLFFVDENIGAMNCG